MLGLREPKLSHSLDPILAVSNDTAEQACQRDRNVEQGAMGPTLCEAIPGSACISVGSSNCGICLGATSRPTLAG